MPRAKPHWGWVEAWLVEELKPKAKHRADIRKMLSAAGITDESSGKAMVGRVFDALGNYRPAQEVLDEGPRAANQLKALRVVEDLVTALSETIDRLDTRTRDDLALCNRVALGALRSDLAALADSITIVQCKLEATESRGAPEKDARRLVLALLVTVFAETGNPATDTRDREEFVRAACRIGDIDLPEDLTDLLPPE